jgi:hypothetical protein
LKKLDLAQTVGLLANLGVIAGIVFLAIELRQNNELLAAQARVARFEMRATDATRAQYENPELAETLRKNRNNEPLSPTEEVIVDRYQRQVLLNWQFVYIEYVNGLLDREEILDSAWRETFNNTPGFRQHWSRSKDSSFRPDFVQFLEENIVNR